MSRSFLVKAKKHYSENHTPCQWEKCHTSSKNVHTGYINKKVASSVSERQYLLQHMLYLSSKLSEAASEKERQNLEQALLFYAKELRKVEAKDRQSYLQ